MVGYFFVGDNMDSFKYLGILEPSIADVWNLEEHKNKPILVYEDRIDHVITRHLRDFGSKEEKRQRSCHSAYFFNSHHNSTERNFVCILF